MKISKDTWQITGNPEENQSKGKRTNTTIRIQINICKIKKNVKLHNERAHGMFENISTHILLKITRVKEEKHMVTYISQPQVSQILVYHHPCLLSFTPFHLKPINLSLDLRKTKTQN